MAQSDVCMYEWMNECMNEWRNVLLVETCLITKIHWNHNMKNGMKMAEMNERFIIESLFVFIFHFISLPHLIR